MKFPIIYLTLNTIIHYIIAMTHELSIQMKKGLLELGALALLAKKERYGYELAELLAQKTDSSIGTIYPILRKLKDAGLLTTLVSEDSSGPPRKYYYITDEGRTVLVQEARNWDRLSAAINIFLKGAN